MLEFERSIQNQAVVIKLSGQLTSLTLTQLQQEADNLDQSEHIGLVFDVSSLLQVDSAGVGLLVSIYKKFQGNQKSFKIAGLHGQPFDIFKLLNLHKVMELSPSVEEAIEQL